MTASLELEEIRLQRGHNLRGGRQCASCSVGLRAKLDFEREAFFGNEIGAHRVRGSLHAAAAHGYAELMHAGGNVEAVELRFFTGGALEKGPAIHFDGEGKHGWEVAQVEFEARVLFGVEGL